MKETAWKSPSNIALIKYWGKHDVQIPANPSVSFTLSSSATSTKLKYRKGKGAVTVFLNGEETPAFIPKIQSFLERTRSLFPFSQQMDFEVHTSNSFPHSSGIASSASGMSALALCMMSIKEELGLNIDDFFREASYAARLGSGSGSRSVYGPLAAWGKHAEIEGSHDEFAVPFADVADIFKTFQDTILLIDKGEKTVSSSLGHGLMNNHPYASSRFAQAHENQSRLLTAMLDADLGSFGEIVESEALTLHGMMMTSMPYFILMKPNTLEVIQRIWSFREATNHPVYFTLDAGANVHVLYPESHKELIMRFIDTELRTFCKDSSYICDKVGLGPTPLF